MSEYLAPQELHTLILKPDLLLVTPGSSHPEVAGGIYGLFDADDTLLYIGKSLHIYNRITQHIHARRRGERSRFAYWGAVDVPTELMSMVEIAHIWALDPPQNSKPRFSDARHGELVLMIQKEWGVNHVPD